MTVTTGNHSVAALRLLQGQSWDLSRIPVAKRGDVMMRAILCGNVVDGKLELSQRDVPCRLLVELDGWLTGTLKFALGDVVMLERTSEALEHYRRRGQEWRVKPLAWTEREMSVALRASRKRISTDLTYYHSSRGVHFLSYTDFHAFAELARTDFPRFREQLRELTSVFEGHATSFLRQPKLHGHHEVELFGLSRGVALARLVPELEKLMEKIVLRRTTQEAVAVRIAEIDALYKSLLTRPELADDGSDAFVETLYMHLTGEIYSVMGEGATPAFDDRRTALPGATFVDGRPVFHPGVDSRSEVLLSNLRALMSKDEHVEYANVYELRTDADDEDGLAIGQGRTREIVYKSDCRPVVASLVEKRLSQSGRGYGSYVIARVQAFTALGVGLAQYRLLRRRFNRGRNFFDYFIRTRCEGEPLVDIPAGYFQMAGEFGGGSEPRDEEVRPGGEDLSLRHGKGNLPVRLRHRGGPPHAEVSLVLFRARFARLARRITYRIQPRRHLPLLYLLLREDARRLRGAPSRGAAGRSRQPLLRGLRVPPARDGVAVHDPARRLRDIRPASAAALRLPCEVALRPLVA